MNSSLKKSILLVFLVLLFDQILKIWVKTHMVLGESIPIIGNSFIIHFTENNGMAFGWELAGEFGKIALSLFRIIACLIIGWYIFNLCKKAANLGLILCVSLILAGALGNIIDSMFYGIIFDDSLLTVANFFPKGGGYASFLHGRVVDMLYFPIIKGTFPSWFPIWKNEPFIFFRPVFNIADSAITVGVLLIIIFQRRFLRKEEETVVVSK